MKHIQTGKEQNDTEFLQQLSWYTNHTSRPANLTSSKTLRLIYYSLMVGGLKVWPVPYVGREASLGSFSVALAIRWCVLVATCSFTPLAPWCAQLKFFQHTLQRNTCALPGTADTNGQTFFHSCEKLHLYLNEPANSAFLCIGGRADSSSLVL